MRLVSTLSVCTALMVAQALTAETAIGQSTPSERGQAIAEKQCARCHAVGLDRHQSDGLGATVP